MFSVKIICALVALTFLSGYALAAPVRKRALPPRLRRIQDQGSSGSFRSTRSSFGADRSLCLSRCSQARFVQLLGFRWLFIRLGKFLRLCQVHGLIEDFRIPVRFSNQSLCLK